MGDTLGVRAKKVRKKNEKFAFRAASVSPRVEFRTESACTTGRSSALHNGAVTGGERAGESNDNVRGRLISVLR